MILILAEVLYTHCEAKSVVGKWKIMYSNPTQEGVLECAAKPKTQNTLNVTLRIPNIAVTDDGFAGTWTLSGNEAVQISVKSLDFYFFFAAEAINANETISRCNESSRGWVSRQGVSRPQGCVRARNLEPENDPLVISSNHGRDPSIKASGPIEKFDKVPYQGDVLPETFDWRNVSNQSFVQPPLDQFYCDSSYAFATLFMMSSRVRVQTNNSYQPFFALQEQIDCNTYANKCHGGLPEQVGKYAEKIGVVEEETYKVEYKGVPGQCRQFDKEKRFYFYQTTALGSQPGIQSVDQIMWELYRYGPVVAGISMQSNFPEPFGDFSGRVDHYLLLVGWTVSADGTPLWIAQNSWGHHWNSDGAAYIARGYNSYGIESAVYVTNWREEGFVQWNDNAKPLMTRNASYSDPTVLIMAVLLAVMSAIAVVLAVLLIIKVVRGKFSRPPAPETAEESK